MCESAFKLRITIDHTGHMCNTLNPKLLIKQTNSDNPELLLMSCSKFILIEGLNTKSRGIDNSLSTDTTELSSTNVEHKKQRRTSLTNFTDDPEKIGRNKNRRKGRNMADAGNKDLQHQEPEEEHQEPQDDETGDVDTAAPTEMYLPDLDNTPLSQALKNALDWGMEDEVMMECLKLKQYFRVDTLLIQRI